MGCGQEWEPRRNHLQSETPQTMVSPPSSTPVIGSRLIVEPTWKLEGKGEKKMWWGFLENETKLKKQRTPSLLSKPPKLNQITLDMSLNYYENIFYGKNKNIAC